MMVNFADDDAETLYKKYNTNRWWWIDDLKRKMLMLQYYNTTTDVSFNFRSCLFVYIGCDGYMFASI